MANDFNVPRKDMQNMRVANCAKYFVAFVAFISLTACVEPNVSSNESTPAPQTISTASMITRQTTAQQDWAIYTSLGYRSLESRLISRCGRFYIPTPISGMDVSSSRARANEIEAAVEAFPQKVACAQTNIQQTSSEFLANVIEYDKAKTLIRQKISLGLYEQGSDEFVYLGRLSANSHPTLQTFESQLAALQESLETGVQRGRQNLAAANQNTQQARAARSAWISAGLSAGVASASQSAGREAEIMRQAQNVAREAAGLPKILSRAEQAALREAYIRSRASTQNETLTVASSTPEPSEVIRGASALAAPVPATTTSSVEEDDQVQTSRVVEEAERVRSEPSVGQDARVQTSATSTSSNVTEQSQETSETLGYAGQTHSSNARMHSTTLEFAQSLTNTSASNAAYEKCRDVGLRLDSSTRQYSVPVCDPGRQYGVDGYWCDVRVTYLCMP